MSRARAKRGELPPPEATIEKLEKMVDDSNFYQAQQMYKSSGARYVTAERYAEAMDLFESGALAQLKHGQVTCGAELGILFVDALVKGKSSYSNDIVDRIGRIYKAFPRIALPQFIGCDDDEMQKLSEAMAAAKVRVESCSSFLKAAIKWSAEAGSSRYGSPELHVMLAEYIYSESPDSDMAKVSSHYVNGNNPEKFASTLVNFMGKCYPDEDDLAIARAVLMYLSQGNLRDANILVDKIKEQLEESAVGLPQSDLMQFIFYLLLILERDAFPLLKVLREKYKSSIDRGDPLFNELLDEVAARFYGARRRNPLQGMLGDIFKMI